jgi:FkbM family methyltransferase
LLSLITPESVVIVVGANIGTIAVPLAREAEITYAFEPQKPIFNLLHDNARLNDLAERMVLMQAAVGAERGTARVPQLDYASRYNFGGVQISEEGVKVEMVTLDDVFFREIKGWDRNFPLNKIDLLHIDVEGWETEVLRGGMEIINKTRPIIYLECDRPGHDTSLRHRLGLLNYRAWPHQPLIAPPAADDHCAKIVSLNRFAVPDEKVKDMQEQILSLSEIV